MEIDRWKVGRWVAIRWYIDPLLQMDPEIEVIYMRVYATYVASSSRSITRK